jgi:hypothetical protein
MNVKRQANRRLLICLSFLYEAYFCNTGRNKVLQGLSNMIVIIITEMDLYYFRQNLSVFVHLLLPFYQVVYLYCLRAEPFLIFFQNKRQWHRLLRLEQV